MKEIPGVVSWKLPSSEMSYQRFHEIFPQRKYPCLQYTVLVFGAK